MPPADAPALQSLVDAVSTTQLLRAAVELGLVDRLSDHHLGSTELADTCATDPSMTRLLLDALTVLGVARRDARGRYRLAVDGLALVAAIDRAWSHLADVVRRGEPVAHMHTVEGAAELYPDLVPSLSALFAPATRHAARLLAGAGPDIPDGPDVPDVPDVLDVLDVGAGAAPWSIALARQSPGVRVTALDLPAVTVATRRAVEAAGLRDRFDYLPADMFTCPLPHAAYDLVLVANVFHLFDHEQNRSLLRRLRPTLRPGGLLAIIDVLAPADRAAQLSTSLYALGLRLRTSHGAVYRLTAYQSWMAEAGFDQPDVETLSASPPLHLLACRTR